MSRARHKKENGGAIGGRKGMLVSGNPDVIDEATEKHKKGGRVKKKEMHAEGDKSKHRADRPRRARGGSVGSDNNPFSSAHKGASNASEPNVEDRRGYKTSPTRG
jgi:hypothetical protein